MRTCPTQEDPKCTPHTASLQSQGKVTHNPQRQRLRLHWNLTECSPTRLLSLALSNRHPTLKPKGWLPQGILIDVNISQRLGQTCTSCLINNLAEKYLVHSAILNYSIGAKLVQRASPPLPRWTVVLKEQRMQKKPLSKQDGHTVWELDLINQACICQGLGTILRI